MLYYSRFVKKKYTTVTIPVTCAFIFIMLLFVKEKKNTKTLSIKCIIQFVNMLNKIHFYVWYIEGVFFIDVIY